MAVELSPRSLIDNTVEPKSPPLPATSGETLTVLVHYYRGELARMAGWRDRIDRTTNWAITVVAALLSVSLSTPTSHHGVLLFAMLLVSLLLFIEARRYRFFDVYRARVRQMERGIFLADARAGRDLPAELVGADRRQPAQAGFSDELPRSDLPAAAAQLFLAVPHPAAGMGAELYAPTLQPGGETGTFMQELRNAAAHASLGPLSGWPVLAIVAMFYAVLTYGAFHREPGEGELAHGEVHV